MNIYLIEYEIFDLPCRMVCVAYSEEGALDVAMLSERARNIEVSLLGVYVGSEYAQPDTICTEQP